MAHDLLDRHRARLLQALVEIDALDVPGGSARPAALIDPLRKLGQALTFDAHALALTLLTGLEFDEPQARRHWAAIADDLLELRSCLERPVAIRTAVLDYFVNFHPQFDCPTLVDEASAPGADNAARGRVTVPALRAGVFREWVDREVRRARRYGHSVSLILADVDGFANVNATLGRAVGDRILATVEARMRQVARGHDRLSRPGDDEFALLLPARACPEAVRLADALRAAVPVDGTIAPLVAGRCRIGLSIGVAAFPGDAPNAAALLERAAQALSEARATGGDRVVRWCPERRRQRRRDGSESWVAEVGDQAREAPATAVRLRDVSRDGVAYYSEVPPPIGAAVVVSLGTRQDSRVARRGRVVRVAPTEAVDKPDFTVGVRFDSPAGPPYARGVDLEP